MCDYSLTHIKSRDAAVEDKLIVHNFGTGTTGFAEASDCGTAICVRPGTEIAFEDNIMVAERWDSPSKELDSKVAIFRQVETDVMLTHHDSLELPSGEIVKLTTLKVGQKAKVICLPVAPKTPEEAKKQERIEVKETSVWY